MNKAAALFLIFVLALPLFAQAQVTSLGETIDVSIINVDVYVTDKQGHRVYGLTPNDFEVREDGELQPISNFAEYAPTGKRAGGRVGVEGVSTTAAVTTTSVSVAPASRRTIVIFVEIAPQPSARIHDVFASLREFVRKSVRPGDAATVLAYETRLETRQEFTDDTKALFVALDRLEKENFGLYPNRDDDARLAKISDENFALAVASATKEVRGDVASLAGFEQQSRMLMELLAMGRKTAALTSIMESMSGVEGKKVMVMALDRFGLALGESSSGQFPIDTRVDRLRNAVMRTANANGVTLYPIHPAGLRWTNFNDPQMQRPDVMAVNSDVDLMRTGFDHAMLMNQTASFLEIAQQTGGLMAAGANDIARMLPQVAEDLESYYSLAYRASSANEERKVAVTTKNRDYQVRSRRAVVDKTDDTRMDDRVVSNLFQTLDYSVIPIELKLGAVKQKRRNRWAIPITVRIPVSGLTQLQRDGAARGTFSVFVGTGGEFGVISEVSRRSQHYSIEEKDFANARSSFFTYTATVEVDRFADAISVAVRDDVSKEFGLARVAISGRGSDEKQGGNPD